MRRLGSVLLVVLVLPSLGFEWEGRLTRLRRELTGPDPERRREVVQLLASYPAAEVSGALLGALEDEDAGVRAQAAEAVGRVRLGEAVPRLLDWLDDPEADVRAAAARALGGIGQATAVPNLVRVLGDNHADVRRAGLTALAAIGGDEVVVPMLGRLDDVDPEVRVEAARLLGHLGDARAVVPLVGRARDDTPEVRAAVYTALGELRDERAVPALVVGLGDDAPEPSLAAVAALGRIGSESAVRPLLSRLDAADSRLPRAVTAALGQIEGESARAAVVDALAHPRTRTMASETLVARARRSTRAGRTEDADRVVLALAEALGRADDPVHATQIADTLSEVSRFHRVEAAAPALLDALREGRGAPPSILRALGATGAPAALVPLLERARADEIAHRLAVLEALSRYFDRAPADGRAADPLLAILGEVTDAEREPVVRLLGRVGAARALPTLRTLLSHRDPALRLAAIRAIGAIGDPEGAPAVVELLDDHDGRLRYEAAQAVGASASPEVIAALVTRVMEREPIDRHAILMALARALPRLEAAGSLAPPLASEARAALIALASGDDDALAARALDAIAAWRDVASAEPLAGALTDAGPRRAIAIVRTLGALDHDAARAALRDALQQPNAPLRTLAASQIGEIGGAEEATLLLALAPELAWPSSAAAAFSLARMARRGVLTTDTAGEGLCALGTSHDPFVRANVAIAFAALAAPPCASGAHPLVWLEPAHAEVVRGAAARWARAAADAGHLPAAAVDQALAACAAEPLAAEVSEVCARPTLAPLDSSADVYAYGPGGERTLPSRLVALRLADGSVFVTSTDRNAHVRLHGAPRGPLALEDPAATPLEP